MLNVTAFLSMQTIFFFSFWGQILFVDGVFYFNTELDIFVTILLRNFVIMLISEVAVLKQVRSFHF